MARASSVCPDKQTHSYKNEPHHDGVISKFNVAVVGAGSDAFMGVESEKGHTQSWGKLVQWVCTEEM